MAAPGETQSDASRLEAGAFRTRMVLFGLLVIVCTLPLFPALSFLVPDKPVKSVIDLYSALMKVPDGSTVLLQTDWTNSTRAESGGEFEAIVRILMSKNCKLAIYSNGDPQAPRVAKDDIMRLNDERKQNGQRPYEHWNDFVSMGFFPNAEGATNAMAADLRAAWSSKKDVNLQGVPEAVFESPVLKNVHAVTDAPMLIIITASNTFNVLIERLSGKLPLTAAVTGVMGPESMVYYSSGQLDGLAVGMKSVYDLEYLMVYGVNEKDSSGKVMVNVPGHEPIPGVPNAKFSKGGRYYPTLHLALGLLIIAVVWGNISMFVERARRAAK